MYKFNWTDFKEQWALRDFEVHMVESVHTYELNAQSNGMFFKSFIYKTDPKNSDQVEFETYFLQLTNVPFPTMIVGVTWSTSTINGIKAFDSSNSALNYFSCKIFDSNGDEITDQSNDVDCVLSQIDFEPSFNYRLLGGNFYQKTQTVNDCYLNFIVLPDVLNLDAVTSANLKLLSTNVSTGFQTDNSSKLVYDAVAKTNRLRVKVFHDAGLKHEIYASLDIKKGL